MCSFNLFQSFAILFKSLHFCIVFQDFCLVKLAILQCKFNEGGIWGQNSCIFLCSRLQKRCFEVQKNKNTYISFEAQLHAFILNNHWNKILHFNIVTICGLSDGRCYIAKSQCLLWDTRRVVYTLNVLVSWGDAGCIKSSYDKEECWSCTY